MENHEHNDEVKQIDLVKMYHAAKKRWYLYPIWCTVAFIVACIIILPVPRYYRSTVKLAPELSSMLSSTSSLSSLAEQFGVNLSNGNAGGDAIMPELYPDLISSVDFTTGLFNVNIQSIDGSIRTTYYNYLDTNQKAAWWEKALGAITKLLQNSGGTSGSIQNRKGVVHPYMLTKRQSEICDMISNKIKCDVDKKNFVISITVEDQDPLISATMADSVKSRLQEFITQYRTKKAKQDLDYALKLQADAKYRYEKARREYAAYADANQDVILQNVSSQTEDLENQMQLLFNNYSALSTQVQTARAKLREQTPAFTKLQSASVPIKPAGPKRMIFCLVFMVIATIIITFYSSIKYKE